MLDIRVARVCTWVALYSRSSCDTCNAIRQQKIIFHSRVWILLPSPPRWRDMCGQRGSDLTLKSLFFFFIFPQFPRWSFKILKYPFNLFFLQIWSFLFLLLFILFEIIYKIGMVFQFHPSRFNWLGSELIYI